MTSRARTQDLSRRERQVMDIVYRVGQVSARDVHAALSDQSSYSAVRGVLRVLVEKQHLQHQFECGHYVYRPTVPRAAASRSALKRVVDTFFGGSVEQTVAALLTTSSTELSDEALAEIEVLIERARDGGD